MVQGQAQGLPLRQRCEAGLLQIACALMIADTARHVGVLWLRRPSCRWIVSPDRTHPGQAGMYAPPANQPRVVRKHLSGVAGDKAVSRQHTGGGGEPSARLTAR